MSSQRSAPTAVAPAEHEPRASAPVPSRWLGLAQSGWVVGAVLAVAILVASIPGYVLDAMRGNWPSRVIAGPAGLLLAGDVAVALTSLADALLCLGLAGLLYRRKPGDRMVLFVSFYLLLYGITWAGPLDRLDAWISGADQVALKANALHGLGFIWGTVGLLVLFPTGRFVPSWTRWLFGLTTLSMPMVIYLASQLFQAVPNLSLRWPLGIYPFLTLAPAGYAQVYRYRRVSTPTERQQTKWVVFGLIVWVLLIQAEGLFNPLNWLHGAALPWWTPYGGLYHYLEAGVIPLTLSVILAAVYAALVVGGQVVVQALTGKPGQNPPFLVASTLLVAGLFNPLRRRLQTDIDRRFYRRKYVAAQTLAAFGATLRHEMDLAELSAQLVAVVEETMQPAHVSLWLRPPST